MRIESTAIDGLLICHLDVHGDNRGWFKENWQREKMVAAGLPDFGPVQNNMSFNATVGVTRGFHAEPWDKLVSVATGRIFGAWVDLRAGDGFGTLVTCEMGPETAVFVPRGVGNAFQCLEAGTAYSYLVNDHWSAQARDSYTFANLADPRVAWPIPLGEAELSEADRHHPELADVTPFTPRPTIILGAGGQLGHALTEILPDAIGLHTADLDLSRPRAVSEHDWGQVGRIINAAAWTNVDGAEADPRGAWAVNAGAVAELAEVARRTRATLVHVSTDYVFDGKADSYSVEAPLSPLGVYGASKAAGELAVRSVPQHYIVRTSAVVGEGKNFVATMIRLATSGVSPSVVDDQVTRLTFADDLAAAIVHLLDSDAPFGTYHVTSHGEATSWFDIASRVFALCGREGEVQRIDTAGYAAGKQMAPRPARSVLNLDSIRGVGFTPCTWESRLDEYVRRAVR